MRSRPAFLGGRHDATHVAVGVRAAVAGVHQHGFAGGRDEERRAAPFDIHEVDAQHVAFRRLRRRRGAEEGQDQQHAES